MRDAESTGKEREKAVVNDIFEILSKTKRKEIIDYLRENGEENLENIARHTGARPSNPENIRRAKIELEHNDIPKMADFGILEYDREGETVSYKGNELVENLIDTGAETEHFNAMSDPKRRETLNCLIEYGESSVYDIANQVRRESEEDRDMYSLGIELKQVHLPKMDNLGLINYNKEESEAEYIGGETTEELLEQTSQYGNISS